MNEWERDCLRWRGRVLVGVFGHWCFGWDGLPIDETCPEWPCECWPAFGWRACFLGSGCE